VARRTGAPWWRQAATLLGIVGLLVTLAFNTLAVRTTARQARQSREAAQIGVLTQLNSNASDSETAINRTPAADRQCKARFVLKSDDDAAVRSALDYYEYLAWLFNNDRLTVSGSRAFFGGRMIDGWRLARHYLGSGQLTLLYPQLTRFVERTPAAQRPPHCARPPA
jgi:hypothetical protein